MVGYETHTVRRMPVEKSRVSLIRCDDRYVNVMRALEALGDRVQLADKRRLCTTRASRYHKRASGERCAPLRPTWRRRRLESSCHR